MSDTKVKTYTRADFSSDQSVRWCPGCGDYAILAQAQKCFRTWVFQKKILFLFPGLAAPAVFLIT